MQLKTHFFSLFCVPVWPNYLLWPGSCPLTDLCLFTDTRPSDECSPRDRNQRGIGDAIIHTTPYTCRTDPTPATRSGTHISVRRTTPRLPHDDTSPWQKPPASPVQHIVLIPFTLSSPIEPIDTP